MLAANCFTRNGKEMEYRGYILLEVIIKKKDQSMGSVMKRESPGEDL